MDTVVSQVVFIAACVYTAGLLLFIPGVLIGLRRRIKPRTTTPKVSVLVCARNEEEHLDDCLRSLTALDYPSGQLEILIVDDRSTDKTGEILKSWSDQDGRIRILTITSELESARGKVNALIQGMDHITGEIVLMTDADCEVSPEWVNEHIRWYDSDTGMVSSMTSLETWSVFSGAHCLEMVQVLALSMAGINYGIPVSVIGNNLSVRKQAYDELGGYRNIDFSVTEDLALFQAVWYSKKWKAKFKANRDIAVLTQPPHDFKTWWNQKHRWVAGGKAIGLPGWVILLLGFVGVLVMVTSPFVLSAKYALIALAMKFGIDLAVLIPTFLSIGRAHRLFFFPFYQLYLFFFLMCVPTLYFQKNVTWKERVYRV